MAHGPQSSVTDVLNRMAEEANEFIAAARMHETTESINPASSVGQSHLVDAMIEFIDIIGWLEAATIQDVPHFRWRMVDAIDHAIRRHRLKCAERNLPPLNLTYDFMDEQRRILIGRPPYSLEMLKALGTKKS